jgi:hypothetical protein
MKKSKFANNPVAQKIKAEARLREAEKDIEVQKFYKYPPEKCRNCLEKEYSDNHWTPNAFLSGFLVGILTMFLFLTVHSWAMGL